MYLVKFTTNSNQEFINEPFRKTENKSNQQKIIKQSQLIEQLTYSVLQAFYPDLPETISEFIEKKKAKQFASIIEFTSGKTLFVVDVEETVIKQIFHKLHQKQISDANRIGNEHVISFNYVLDPLEGSWEQETYSKLVSKINQINPGYQMLETMFESLMVDRSNMNYDLKNKQKDNSDKTNVINLLEIGAVSSDIEILNKQSYSSEGNTSIYNKLLVYKLDLNNIGVSFEKIKLESIEKYSTVSISFFEVIRIDYIQDKFDHLGLNSKCMFAAGDDIMILTRFDEIERVQQVLNDLITEINKLFDDKDVMVTYAGGLQVIDYRLPIRLYYREVEMSLNQAKQDKNNNMIAFNNQVYTDQQFAQLITYAKQIVNIEDRFKLSSTIYYNILTRLEKEQDIDVRLNVLNALVNDNSDHDNIIGLFLQLTTDNQLAQEVSNIIQFAMHYACLAASDEPLDFELDIETITNDLKVNYRLNEVLEAFGNSTGFYSELLNKSHLDKQQFREHLEDVIFRKMNELYYQLDGYQDVLVFLEDLEPADRKNTLLACILHNKLLRMELEETNEKN